MRTPSLILMFRKESESEGLGGQAKLIANIFFFIFANSFVGL